MTARKPSPARSRGRKILLKTDEELDLIYIAKKLKEALALEERLTERGIDYYVEPDTYTGGVIFRRSRVGAFFYVRPSDRERSLPVLADHGYAPLAP